MPNYNFRSHDLKNLHANENQYVSLNSINPPAMNFVFKLKLSSCFLEILEMGKCGCAKCRKRQSGSAKLKGINTEENKGDKQNQIFCYFYWPSRIL